MIELGLVLWLSFALRCHAGIDTSTGSIVSLERPANFDAAVKTLGLQHAVGSLRLVKFDSSCATASNENIDVANMPTQAQQADMQRDVTQEEQSADQSAWVPLHLQLGLPLMPAELCDLVCRYVIDCFPPCHVHHVHEHYVAFEDDTDAFKLCTQHTYSKLCVAMCSATDYCYVGAVCSQATAARFLDADSRRQHQEGQAQLQRQLFSIISEYGACTNCQAATGRKEDEAVTFVDLPIYNLLFDGKQMHQLDYSDYQQGIGCLCIE